MSEGKPKLRQMLEEKAKALGFAAVGVARATRDIEMHVHMRGLQRLWLHIDVDVLDEREMPAVDSPGRPGLTYAELSQLLATLCSRLPVIGADVSVFDPDLDPTGRYADELAACLAKGLVALRSAP